MSRVLRFTEEEFHARVSARMSRPLPDEANPKPAPGVLAKNATTGEAGIGEGIDAPAHSEKGGLVMLPYPISANRPWNEINTSFLIENYPLKGKAWCANALGMLEHQIRSKASRLGLKARGMSEAWKEKQASHASKLTGRKRPEQAAVMKSAIHDKGLHIHSEEVNKKLGAINAARFKEQGHPRGMLGKKHGAAAKERMSAAGQARSASETDDMRADRALKMLKTKAANGTTAGPRIGATWKCGWREIGGQRCYFRSAWEANYARYLQFLLEKNQITKWEHEPETFWFEKIKRGCRSYLPDFRVTEPSGAIVYHEVKGWMDDRSKTKIKRMGIYHPAVRLIVIDTKPYKAIQKTVSSLIDGWES